MEAAAEEAGFFQLDDDDNVDELTASGEEGDEIHKYYDFYEKEQEKEESDQIEASVAP